jgi:folate-binding Fe-S cluster repair protein YgfZ
VISIRGSSATTILQNLITQDMKLFKDEGLSRAAVFTAFLTVKGKVMFDAIIVKPRLAE